MLFVLFPVLDEGDAPLRMVREIRALGLPWPVDVTVLDDGSTDGGPVRLRREEPDVRVLRHERPQGAGASLRELIVDALERGRDGDVAVTLEGDGTCDLDALASVAEPLVGGEADVVAASRYVRGGSDGGGPPVRRMISRTANALLPRLLGGPRIDLTCFYRGYAIGPLQRALARPDGELDRSALPADDGFAWNLAFALELHRRGLRFDQVAQRYRRDLKAGASKMRLAREMRTYTRLVWTSRVAGRRR